MPTIKLKKMKFYKKRGYYLAIPKAFWTHLEGFAEALCYDLTFWVDDQIVAVFKAVEPVRYDRTTTKSRPPIFQLHPTKKLNKTRNYIVEITY